MTELNQTLEDEVKALREQVADLKAELAHLHHSAMYSFISPVKYGEQEFLSIEDAMEDDNIPKLEVVRFEKRATLDYFSAYKDADGDLVIYSDFEDRAKDAFNEVYFLKKQQAIAETGTDEHVAQSYNPALFIKDVLGTWVVEEDVMKAGPFIVRNGNPIYATRGMVEALTTVLLGGKDEKGNRKADGLYRRSGLSVYYLGGENGDGPTLTFTSPLKQSAIVIEANIGKNSVTLTCEGFDVSGYEVYDNVYDENGDVVLHDIHQVWEYDERG